MHACTHARPPAHLYGLVLPVVIGALVTGAAMGAVRLLHACLSAAARQHAAAPNR